MFRPEKDYQDGDILKFVSQDKLIWGISVGNGMVVYVEKSCSRVKLNNIVVVGKDSEIAVVKSHISFFSGCFLKKSRTDEIVEKALQYIGTESSLDSKGFVDFCVQRFRSELYVVLLFLAFHVWYAYHSPLSGILVSWLDSYLVIALINFGLCLIFLSYSHTSFKSLLRTATLKFKNSMSGNKQENCEIQLKGQKNISYSICSDALNNNVSPYFHEVIQKSTDLIDSQTP